jgi:Sulfotransferase family
LVPQPTSRLRLGYADVRRDQLPPHPTATYVLPRFKVVYVSVPKAACTSIKWLIAELQGEDPRRFYGSLTREVARATTIHRRALWQHTPMLHRLSDKELEAVSPEQGWFVFAVVRHPSARVWSAWQSKLLLQEPRWVERFGGEPWFPRVPTTTDEVVEDFQRFVRSIAEAPRQPVMRDRHLRPQARLLTPGRMPYTRIYKTPEIPELLEDLAAHLRRYGWRGELELGSSNETPLRPLRSMFTPEILAGIKAVYREDFRRFGYESPEPDRYEPTESYADSTLREVARLAERGERIGDLSLHAQRLNRLGKAQQEEIRELRRKLRRQRVGKLDPVPLVRRGRRLAGSALKRAGLNARRLTRAVQADD